MIKINLLRDGDEVLTVNETFLAIKRASGEVDIFDVCFNTDGEMVVDPIKQAVIGYGDGTVEKALDDDETTIFTF